MKLLLWAAIVLIVVWAWRSNARRAGTAARQDASAAEGESMVSCAHCGVYLPASEAVVQGSLQFCSAQHRQLHRPS